jgi:hypothetical protein
MPTGPVQSLPAQTATLRILGGLQDRANNNRIESQSIVVSRFSGGEPSISMVNFKWLFSLQF